MEILFNWDDQRWKGNDGSDLFEELCCNLLTAMDYKNLKWRKGSGDRGRDIDCEFYRDEPDGSTLVEKWFCEAKRYESGVNVNDLITKIAWADTQKPDNVLFIVSSHLTPDAKDWIDAIQKDKKYRIGYWERFKLENLIQKHHNQMLNIEKYFVVIEDDINTLYEKFYKAKQLLKERRFVHIKKLEAEITDKADSSKLKEIVSRYEELINIKRELKEYKQAQEDIEKVKPFYEKLGDREALFKNILMKGDIELEQSQGFYASRTYEDAAKFADSNNNTTWKGMARFKSGQAFHSTFRQDDYSRALNHYKEALKLCLPTETEIQIKVAELYLDFGKTKEFLELIDTIHSADKEILVRKKLIIARYLIEVHDWIEAQKIIKEAIAQINGSNQQLLLNAKMISAYIEWKQASYDSAIQILSVECIPVITRLQDEELLMVVYQNIALVKMEKSSAESQSNVDFWTEHGQWVDISNRLEKNYERAQLKSLYAEEKINESEFAEALGLLRQSRKYFSDLNSWSGESQIDKKMGLLASRTGNIPLAMWQYIKLGEIKHLEQLISESITKLDKQQLFLLILGMLSIKNSTRKEQIGICTSLGKLADLMPDELITVATDKLIELLALDQTKKNALDGLKEYSRRLPNSKITEIIDRLLQLLTDDKERWTIRESVSNLLNAFANNMPLEDRSRVVDMLCSQLDIEYHKEEHGTIGVISSIEVALTNIGKHSSGELKNRVIEKIKSVPASTRHLEYLYYLGLKVTNETIINVIDNAVSTVMDRVVIHDINAPKPEMKNIYFMTSFTLDANTMVTVGTIPEMPYLEYIKDDVPPDSAKNLIDSFMNMLTNEYNIISNKELLLSYLGTCASIIPTSQLHNVINKLFSFAQGNFNLSPIDKMAIESVNDPYSTYRMNMGKPEDLIVEATDSLSKYYCRMADDQKESYLALIHQFANHPYDKLRIACARSIKKIGKMKLDTGLILYSLVSDTADLVRAYAIDSFASIEKDNLPPVLITMILNKALHFASEDSSRDTMLAVANLTKILRNKKETLSLSDRAILTNLEDIIGNSKYFSARQELIAGLSGE